MAGYVVNSVDPDQALLYAVLIWIYSLHPLLRALS